MRPNPLRFGVGLVIFATLWSAGCWFQGIRDSELVGRYGVMLPEGAYETLELLAGGVSMQEIRLKGGAVYSARGRWTYDDQKKYLSLTGTRIAVTLTGELNPEVSQMPPPASASSRPVGRTIAGELYITLSHNGSLHYERKP